MAMPIVTGQEMAAIDRTAIEKRGIPGLDLMEGAGSAVAAWISSRAPESWLDDILIVAGGGNNGGDGFVIARLLIEEGLRVQTLVIGDPERIRGDALHNLLRLRELGAKIDCEMDPAGFEKRWANRRPSLIVDALLGTGITGVPRPLQSCAIQWIKANFDAIPVIAVDIPSGVVSDNGSIPGDAVQADHTFTFGLPKFGHVLPPGQDTIGDLHICDIGFPADLMAAAQTETYYLTAGDIRAWLPKPRISAHKGNRGRLLIVAGSRGMSGAAILAAKAAVAAGAGLVTLALPESQQSVAAGAAWEVLTLPLPETPDGTLADSALAILLEAAAPMDAVAAGPGLGRKDAVGRVIQGLLDLPQPLLLDADGIWAVTPAALAHRPSPTLLTPHPGELAMLLGLAGPASVQAERLGMAKQAAEVTKATVLLKGAATVIANSGQPLLVNPTGNSGLATGGAGDVLTGIAGALLAQGLDTIRAGATAAYIHGAAADLIRDNERTTFSAGSLIEPAAEVLGRLALRRPSETERMPGDIPVLVDRSR